MNIPDVEIIEEDPFDPQGSCCEDGYYKVEKCKGWWYQCPEWGLKDMQPWLTFGPNGFTTPPTTEHALRCVYSKEKKLCRTHDKSCDEDLILNNNGNSIKILPKKKEIFYPKNTVAFDFHINSVRDTEYIKEGKKYRFISHATDTLDSALVNGSYYFNKDMCKMKLIPTYLGSKNFTDTYNNLLLNSN